MTTKTPPLIACVQEFDARGVDEILSSGNDVDINAQDEQGMTALHYAAVYAARPCIRLLVASGKCDYLIRDHKGRYASDLAIEWSRDYAVGRLLTKHQIRQAFARGVPAWVPPGKPDPVPNPQVRPPTHG
jgi:ankyrin repeat protein